eukprot:GHVU01063504.1.p1 GENE.GHVU01063504.1~~GHVU01063504.1.p1  ORF type:complete len:139 (-),score=12.38 GHVU01063504.1:370-786(-)
MGGVQQQQQQLPYATPHIHQRRTTKCRYLMDHFDCVLLLGPLRHSPINYRELSLTDSIRNLIVGPTVQRVGHPSEFSIQRQGGTDPPPPTISAPPRDPRCPPPTTAPLRNSTERGEQCAPPLLSSLPKIKFTNPTPKP